MKQILSLIFIFLLFGCVAENREEIPFIVYENVQYQNLSPDKIFQGFIDRALDVDLSFGLSGIMKSLYVDEGEFVKKGTLLARLDNDEYNLQIKRAKTELDDANVKYNRAKSYFERITKLHQAGGISYNDWEAAQTNLKTSINQIQILKDALDIAKDKEGFSNIYAPYDGYIIKRFKDPMQFVNAGERVIYFQGRGNLEARVFVSQNDINKINIGDFVILKADSIPNKEFKGKIKSKVNSSINEGSYRITVSIDEDNKELLDGMSINIYFEKFKTPSSITLPISSIVSEKDAKYVYILNKTSSNFGTVKKTQIKSGQIIKDRIQIISGLKVGDNVVIDGVNKIMDGSKVEF